MATQRAEPDQDKLTELLKPTSDQIAAIQSIREKNWASIFFNHLSAISESIAALGWVCVVSHILIFIKTITVNSLNDLVKIFM